MATQSEIKYNRLMEKAQGLFLDLGYRTVSMDQIAEAAGISRMTIYKYFESKEALFMATIYKLMEDAFTVIENEIKDISGTLEKINYLTNYSLEQSKRYSLAFANDILAIPYVTEKLLEEKLRLSRVLFKNIIQEGVDKGEIRMVNVKFVTDMLIMMIASFGQNYMGHVDYQEQLSEMTSNFYDFLKYGLMGRPEVE